LLAVQAFCLERTNWNWIWRDKEKNKHNKETNKNKRTNKQKKQAERQTNEHAITKAILKLTWKLKTLTQTVHGRCTEIPDHSYLCVVFERILGAGL